jgi:hypothetical protein
MYIYIYIYIYICILLCVSLYNMCVRVSIGDNGAARNDGTPRRGVPIDVNRCDG